MLVSAVLAAQAFAFAELADAAEQEAEASDESATSGATHSLTHSALHPRTSKESAAGTGAADRQRGGI